MATMSPQRALSLESSFGGAADTFSNVASLSSTPPTTVADSMSLASDASKHDNAITSDPIDEITQEHIPDELPASLMAYDAIIEGKAAHVQVHVDLPAEKPVEVSVDAPQETTEETPEQGSEASSRQHLEELSNVLSEEHPEEPSEAPREQLPVASPEQAPQSDELAATAPTTTSSGTPNIPSSTRPRRERRNPPVYNLAKLVGTSIHGKRRSHGDTSARRRTISGDVLVDKAEGGNASIEANAKNGDKLVQDEANALDMKSSTRGSMTPKSKSKASKKRAASLEPKRIATRSSGAQVENLTAKLSTLGKRGRKPFQERLSKVSLEIKRLADTNEFAGVETKPVLYTTWAKGKLVTHEEPEPTKKKRKVSESPKKAAPAAPAPTPELEPSVEEAPAAKPRRVKKWMEHGLYSGQDPPLDVNRHLTPNERKTLSELPELVPSGAVNKTLPQPIYNGLRLLIRGRDFKLPFDICHPLPPGQPKPDEWKKMTRNRFVGNASAIWKKMPHFNDYQSKCVCTPEDGCTESCQNRIMLYECDTTNCNAGAAYCHNRAFARLTERVKAGGKYRVGVEVVKTDDRGYGIRSNRCFEANQIIMEYTGEIITEAECDRRMNEKYKDNQCYYLMSFDQNMIIDATTGSIARFVNHSCTPNCRMIKWVVSGQPRMALFAGDRPIMTGEELTYDYNFDPFSAKNVQKCLCGSPNCRGVLGPKPKEVKPPKPSKEDLKNAVKNGVKVGKRKLKEFLGDKTDEEGSATKKRKIRTPTGIKTKGVKRSISETSLKAAKGAAKMVKRSMSTISVSAKAALGSKSPASGRKLASIKRKSNLVKTYSKTKVINRVSTTSNKAASVTPKKSTSRKSSLTIVAAAAVGNDESAKPATATPASAKSIIKAPNPTPKGRKPYTPTGRPRGRPRKHPLPVVEHSGPPAVELPAVENSDATAVETSDDSEDLEDSPRQAIEISRSSNEIRLVDSAAF